MLKMLFLDFRDHEIVEGFTRKVEAARKHRGNPVLISDHPAEGNSVSLYGSVIRRPDDGLFQMWYTVRHPKLGGCVAYAESEDGVAWRRVDQDVIKLGRKRTHLVFSKSPHGTTVMYDPAEQRAIWKYKMLTGASASHRISAFRSADGVHWADAAENPVIGSNPDCPMSIHRTAQGKYVAYHRPGWADRRVGRSESWDFIHWSEPKMVLDQEPADDAQTQFYGLGSLPYGAYEIGTLWIYHTVAEDMDFYKMKGRQETELAYTRSGYSWHRAGVGAPLIALGPKGAWDWGAIQAASSPLFLDDEIRIYFMGSRVDHGTKEYRGKEPRCGIGFASLKPDRFVGMVAKGRGRILTRAFWTEAPEFYVNAAVESGGNVRAELLEVDGKPIRGFEMKSCLPVSGDSTSHRLIWRGEPDRSGLANRLLRLRVEANRASIYSLFSGSAEEVRTYWKFRIPGYMDMANEKQRFGW